MSDLGGKSEVAPHEIYQSKNVEKNSEESYSPVFTGHNQPYCYRASSNGNEKTITNYHPKILKQKYGRSQFNYPSLQINEASSSKTEDLNEIRVEEQSVLHFSYEKINSSEANIESTVSPKEYARSIDRIHEGIVENRESKTEVQQDVGKAQKHTGNWQELEFNNESNGDTKIQCLNTKPFYVENNTGTHEVADCNTNNLEQYVHCRFESDSLSKEESTVKTEDYRQLRCSNPVAGHFKQAACLNHSYFREITPEDNEEENVKIVTQLNLLIQQLEQQSPLWKPLGGNTNKAEEISNYIKSVEKQNAELANQINIFKHEKEALRINAVIEEESKDKRKLEEKLADSQELLERNKAVRKLLEEKCKNLETSLNKELENKSRFKRYLQEMLNTTTENDNVDKHLQKISNIVAEYSKPFSKQELSGKAEEEFIRSSLQKIQNLEHKAKALEDKIKSFCGDRKDKTYLHIKEMLFRAIEELDNVESDKKEEILKARRNCIDYVKRLWDDLEKRVK